MRERSVPYQASAAVARTVSFCDDMGDSLGIMHMARARSQKLGPPGLMEASASLTGKDALDAPLMGPSSHTEELPQFLQVRALDPSSRG